MSTADDYPESFSRLIKSSRGAVGYVVFFMCIAFPLLYAVGCGSYLRPIPENSVPLGTVFLAISLVLSTVTTKATLRHPSNYLPLPGYKKWAAPAVVLPFIGCLGAVSLQVFGSLGDAETIAVQTVFLSGSMALCLGPLALSEMFFFAGLPSLLYMALPSLGAPSGVPPLFSLMFIAPMVFAVAWYTSTQTQGVIQKAFKDRDIQAQLDVAGERLRLAQELHDTLGQHLAAMSVKAELARALVDKNDPRADDVLAELHRMTKVSTDEMRSVVSGYREINLATEIAGMEQLFDDASIAVDINGDAFDVPEPRRTLAAWFMREATTNVLKHSHAKNVTLNLGEREVSMTNDGVTGDPGELHGLASLDDRARAAGSAVTVTRDGNRFTARLEMGQ